jgi:solute carrier family 35 protein F1/2
VVCIGGLGLLVASDRLTNRQSEAVARGKGDAFMLAGATLYGFSAFRQLAVEKKA